MSCSGCARRRAKLKAAAQKARNALRNNTPTAGGSGPSVDIPKHQAAVEKAK